MPHPLSPIFQAFAQHVAEHHPDGRWGEGGWGPRYRHGGRGEGWESWTGGSREDYKRWATGNWEDWGPGRRRRGRFFEQGEIRYVVLRLLDEKPRHGYEIIKELEDRMGGQYAPSPGTVYPLLTMLEDLGYAEVEPAGGNRKRYAITAEGKAHLAEHRAKVDALFERMAEARGEGEKGEGGPWADIKAAFGHLKVAFGHLAWTTWSTAPRVRQDPAKLDRIREVLERATREIQEVAKA